MLHAFYFTTTKVDVDFRLIKKWQEPFCLNPLRPERAKILAQGFFPTLSTITRQLVELESC